MTEQKQLEDLINLQHSIYEEIKQIFMNYKKDSEQRKTKRYIEDRLQKVRAAYSTFTARDASIRGLQETFGDHPSFKNNFFDQVKKLYDQFTSTLEEKLDSIAKDYSKESVSNDKFSTNRNDHGETRTEDEHPSNINTTVSIQETRYKRQSIKMKTLQGRIEKAQEEIKIVHSDIYFRQTLESMSKCWDEIMKNHEDILTYSNSDEDHPYLKSNDFNQLEQQYEDIAVVIKEKIQSIQSIQKIETKAENLKLPSLNIPHFNRNYNTWKSFHDIFVSAIHDNASLGATRKMQYLKTYVVGEASNVIRHLEICERNYLTAWELLLHRSDNERAIISAQLYSFFAIQPANDESATTIRRMHDKTVECLHAIENMGIETSQWDPIIIHILTQKIDKETHKLYEQSLKDSRKVQKLSDFLEFLTARFNALEVLEDPKGRKSKNTVKSFPTSINTKCNLCDSTHYMYECPKFISMKVGQRKEITRKQPLSYHCLRSAHSMSKCLSKRTCKICHKRLHSLLHNVNTEKPNKEQMNEGTSTQEVTVHTQFENNLNNVLLATVLFNVLASDSSYITLRALLDQGSQCTFITEKAVQILRLRKSKIYANISGIGESSEACNSITQVTIKPRFTSDIIIKANALVLLKLTKQLPGQYWNIQNWQHLKNITLADPKFYTPGQIDLILGGDIYSDIIQKGMIKVSSKLPIAQQTQLGWIISGQIKSERVVPKVINCVISRVDVNDLLKKFWEYKDIQCEPKQESDGSECENLFNANHKRDKDRRYVVRLPFKSKNMQLGSSKKYAIARLMQLERKFKTGTALEDEYKKFMREYLEIGHMIPVHGSTETDENSYYLPHHAVRREDSATTKVRVVFDASAKTSNGTSLNEQMYAGPKLQEELISILVRWRTHKYAFTADIEKMYRQIKIHSNDQNYQRIVRRNNTSEPIQEYELTTVTYGTKAAPYLAIRTIHQLANDVQETFSSISSIIKQDFYVDDLLSGNDKIEDAIKAQKLLVDIFQGAGFNLRKGGANDPRILNEIPSNSRRIEPINIDAGNYVKTLGIYWNPYSDEFGLQIKLPQQEQRMTKRVFLSETSTLFDPLGWIAPVIIGIRIMYQEIWAKNLNWDDELPAEIKIQWYNLRNEIKELEKISLPRWLHTFSDKSFELHGFCDASTKAYSAVIYSKVQKDDGTFIITLIAAKTRVAPIKQETTLPRLELCAAFLLSKLMKKIIKAINRPQLNIYAYTDSMITQAWIQGNALKWKTFVSNHVIEIQNIIKKENWYHVKTEDNPADCASRGIKPIQLLNHRLWWTGPEWLHRKDTPKNENFITSTDTEAKTIIAAPALLYDQVFQQNLLLRFSKLQTLLRVVAYCLRMSPKVTTRGNLQVIEIEYARIAVIRIVQNLDFIKEIQAIQQEKPLARDSKILSLNPFIDKMGILRVGGRLENSNLQYDEKHPIILSYKNPLTTLFIDNAHQKTLNGGVSLTLAQIRKQYWIIKAQNAVCNYIHNCIKCFRHTTRKREQLMGNLRAQRVQISRPFTNSGVDYAGPIDIKAWKGRCSKTLKGYIAVFKCMATKTIHLELLTELTANAFLAAYKGFTSRRGICKHMYSDCGTNFAAASKIIKQELRIIYTQWKEEVAEELVKQEFTTLVTQIEACLNSRPLCPLEENADSMGVLTPGHFLIGETILTPPGPSVLDENISHMNRWQYIQKLHQDFWRKWSQDYLFRLQQRPKWDERSENVKMNDIFLIRDEQTPPSMWALGKIIECHPVKDGLIRVVTLKIKGNKTSKRPISKICPLPVNNPTNIPTSSVEVKQNSPPEIIQQKPNQHYNMRKRKIPPINPEWTRNKKEKMNCKSTPKPISANCVAILLLIIFLLPLAMCQELTKIIPFKDHPGLYFEEFNPVKMTNSE